VVDDRMARAQRRQAARQQAPDLEHAEQVQADQREQDRQPATKTGDCSWKPQPSWSPAARSASSRPASATNDTTTPSV
jgi:hypothetical protein